MSPGKVSEDVIGNTYIYLIERFAADAGKKAGEFYTPHKISQRWWSSIHRSLRSEFVVPVGGRDSAIQQEVAAGDERSVRPHQERGTAPTSFGVPMMRPAAGDSVDDRGAHLEPGVAEDFCGRIGILLAQVRQQDVLACADSPRNRLTNQPRTADDVHTFHFVLL